METTASTTGHICTACGGYADPWGDPRREVHGGLTEAEIAAANPAVADEARFHAWAQGENLMSLTAARLGWIARREGDTFAEVTEGVSILTADGAGHAFWAGYRAFGGDEPCHAQHADRTACQWPAEHLSRHADRRGGTF